MKITFLTGWEYKILDFTYDEGKVSNLHIYDHRSAKNVLRDVDCRLTSASLLELFRHYLGGNGTMDDYLKHIIENGFFTPYSINLRAIIEDD